nr:hypothetical protein [Tanacetum cinerariifolium]
MENTEQAFVDYASSCTNEVGGKWFTLNKGPTNFNDSANTWKEKSNFNWDDMIGKINLLWKTVSEKLNDVSTSENARNSMAPKSIAVISHAKREELKKKGIKISSNKDSDTEDEDVSSTNMHEHGLGSMMRNKQEVKEQGNEEDAMETDEEVEKSVETASRFTRDAVTTTAVTGSQYP